ncbi:UbiA family prenyltransferase [Streptosporangium sp. NPDC023615]|uniref:UbiA family prenyltransferase n=1 Tax=Streptosporangium sp. NPDC023615 TaxID=3154794 RepID=UPI003435B634
MAALSSRAPAPRALFSRVLVLCVTEARPAVLAVSAMRYLTGVALALPAATAAASFPRVAQGAVAWVLSILAIYLYNGVTDVTEDRINGSGRPIARGDLEARTAAAVAAGAGGLALLATWGLPSQLFWIVAANLGLGYLYSGPPAPLKDSSGGTVAVLCLSGLLSYLAGFTVATQGGDVAPPAALVLFAAVAIGWMVFVGMPAKDLSDIAGDAAAGRRTLGVLLGERLSRQVMVGAAVVLLTGFAVTVSLTQVRLAGVVLALAAGVVAVALAALPAAARPGAGGRRRTRRAYEAFMGTQHLLHVAAFLSWI